MKSQNRVVPGLLALSICSTLATLTISAGSAAATPGPRLRLEPAALTFTHAGEVREVTLRNTGTNVLRIGSTRVWHDGSGVPVFTADPLEATGLLPGQTVALHVRFVPTAATAPLPPGGAFGALLVPCDDDTLPGDPNPGGGAYIGSVALRSSQGPPLLSLIVFFPLLGIPFILLVPRGRESLTRIVALVTTAVPLGLALWMIRQFDPTVTRTAGTWGLQFVEHHGWIRGFPVEYFLGVDGLSVTMVLLTALITVIAVGASWSIPLTQHIRGYFALLLLLEVGMLGVFCALDFFLFYMFWEVMLLPMYFLIGIWGGPRKEYAAIKFFLYTLAGSVLMLLAIIALYYSSKATYLVDGTPTAHTFDMMKLAWANDFGAESPIAGFAFPRIVWLAFFVAFAIKVPVVPLHTWLPDAHVEAPTAVSVILAGVLLKMGVYGMMRVNLSILPEATHWAAQGLAVLGVVGMLYGALVAMAQTDLKRLVAYSSVSHMGYCLLGLSALTPTGLTGAVAQMFNHGTITAMMFLLVGALYDRTHTRELSQFGGVAHVMPRYATVFGLAFMASLGLPGLSGFIGEVLVFIGAFPAWQALTITAALSVIITAAYHLSAIEKVLLGPFNERWRSALAGFDLDLREAATLVPLAIIVIVLGFWPAPLLTTITATVQDLLTAVATP